MKQKLVSPRVDPLPGTTVNATGSEKHRRVGTFFWILGALVLFVASVMVHLHPGPWLADCTRPSFFSICIPGRGSFRS